MKTYLVRWIRRWREILLTIIQGVSLYWLLVEIASYSTANAIDVYLKNIPTFLWVFMLIVLVSGIINRPRSHFEYRLRDKDNKIEVRIGDIFKRPGAIVVPVNDYFDMSLGGNILKSKTSIQCQLINKYYAGKTEHLEADIAAKVSVGTKYDVGKTIEIEQSGKKFYLVVNSIRKENNRVSSEVDHFIQTLNGLWQYIALESGRDSAVRIPLLSTQHGRSSYLSRMTAIKEMITSYVETSKGLNICEKLVITISPLDLQKGDIDLDEIDNFLRFSCQHYRQVMMEAKSDNPEDGSRIIRIDN